jgi:hypothetical protein
MKIKSVTFGKQVRFGNKYYNSVDLAHGEFAGYALDFKSGLLEITDPKGVVKLIPTPNIAEMCPLEEGEVVVVAKDVSRAVQALDPVAIAKEDGREYVREDGTVTKGKVLR